MARKALLLVAAALLACVTLAAAGPVVVPVTPPSAYAAQGAIYNGIFVMMLEFMAMKGTRSAAQFQDFSLA